MIILVAIKCVFLPAVLRGGGPHGGQQVDRAVGGDPGGRALGADEHDRARVLDCEI